MGFPRGERERRALETRVRSACLRVVCPEHGVSAKDILFSWSDERLEVEVHPLPCCSAHNDAICAAFTETIGGRPAQ